MFMLMGIRLLAATPFSLAYALAADGYHGSTG